MARKATVVQARVEVPPDPRPLGSFVSAGPSEAAFARHIHTFDPFSEDNGADAGVRTINPAGRGIPYRDYANPIPSARERRRAHGDEEDTP